MRESGILMPISSLPGAGGIGCFGAEAYHFVDFLAKAGQTIWQILPLSPTGYGDSPYQSCSAFAGNPYFISLDTLKKEGLLKAADLKDVYWGSDETQVDYGAVYNARFALLRQAFANWKTQCAGKNGCAQYLPDEYYAYVLKNEHWLPDYAMYMAIKAQQGMKPWNQWPEELKLRNADALAKFAADNADEELFWQFIQFKFGEQWAELKAYANAKGIKIMGDVPIYVSADSVDAWTGGKLFEVDAKGDFARVAGCPPDMFAADGQLWGNPVYDWTYHEQTGYAWWISRVRSALETYDMLRIDHFRGFDTYWAIPAGAPTARTGKWEQGPGMKLFNALEAALGKLPIVAEDLGELFDSVRVLLKDSGFPGMKVLQFAFDSVDSEYLPHNCQQNFVVYPGTHDNTTIRDWLDTADKKTKDNLYRYLHLDKNADARLPLIRAALGTASDWTIIPMYDWLGCGAEAHLNTPGRLGGNWAWRAAKGFDSAKLAKEISYECEPYCRVPLKEEPAEVTPAAAE